MLSAGVRTLAQDTARCGASPTLPGWVGTQLTRPHPACWKSNSRCGTSRGRAAAWCGGGHVVRDLRRASLGGLRLKIWVDGPLDAFELLGLLRGGLDGRAVGMGNHPSEVEIQDGPHRVRRSWPRDGFKAPDGNVEQVPVLNAAPADNFLLWRRVRGSRPSCGLNPRAWPASRRRPPPDGGGGGRSPAGDDRVDGPGRSGDSRAAWAARP